MSLLGNSQFVLQVAAIAVGGGSVQLAIFLLRRRAELRTLDATSGSTALTSANAFILTLQSGDVTRVAEITALKAEAQSKELRRDAERDADRAAMDNAQREISRMSADLARTRADLAAAQAQIDELALRLSGQSHRPGWPPTPGPRT